MKVYKSDVNRIVENALNIFKGNKVITYLEVLRKETFRDTFEVRDPLFFPKTSVVHVLEDHSLYLILDKQNIRIYYDAKIERYTFLVIKGVEEKRYKTFDRYLKDIDFKEITTTLFKELNKK